MASREKRPLAPSKSKQRANNESILGSATQQNNRKRTQTATLKQQQLAREILDAVAGGSELSPKLEAALPRKKAIRSLRRKQKLRNAKSNLINVKVTKKVPIKNIRRITVDVKKGVKLKKVKRLVEADRRVAPKSEEQRAEKDQQDEEEGEGEIENSVKTEDQETLASAEGRREEAAEEEETEVPEDNNEAESRKNNCRTKRGKSTSRGAFEESEIVPSNETAESFSSTSTKNSPKSARKFKTEIPESPTRISKTGKNASTTKRTASKERDAIKSGFASGPLTGSTTQLTTSPGSTVTTSLETRYPKKSSPNVDSVDLTIEEVVASMQSDEDKEDTETTGGKVTRSKKMLIDEKFFTDVEIKKELIESQDEVRSVTDEERPQTPQQQDQATPSIQLRNRSGNSSFGQRSLRNGKLRQLTDSGVSTDSSEVKKRRWLNLEEAASGESGELISVDSVSDVGAIDAESSFSESSGNTDNRSNAASSKDDSSPVKSESPMDFESSIIESNLELENNNNSERVDRASGVEVGPILRSKTKAKSTEVEMKLEDVDNLEEPRPLGRSLAGQLEPRKSGSLDQLRKDSFSKVIDGNKAPKSRRSSLNIDVKKTMGSFYGNSEKTENSSKSQIDQMIENIKLTIAKSIESKIFGPEKTGGMVRNKNFQVPKIEEIVAPLSADSQKLGLEETTHVPDDEKQNTSKCEIGASNSSDNSVPKVADTAKEIEKLVMGDIELVETQNSESASVEAPRDEQSIDEQQPDDSNVLEREPIVEGSDKSDNKIVDDATSNENTKNPEQQVVEESENDQKESKKCVVTRKSLRNKSWNENTVDLDNSNGKTSVSSDENSEKIKSNLISEETEKTEETSAESSEPKEEKSQDSEKSSDNEISMEITSDAIIEGIKKQIEDKKGLAVESSTSLISEDQETLESIEKEVERLVGESANNPGHKEDETAVEKREIRTDEDEKTAERALSSPRAEETETEKSAAASINVDEKPSKIAEEKAVETIACQVENDSTRMGTSETRPDDNETVKMHKTNSPTTDKQEKIITEKSPSKENPCSQEPVAAAAAPAPAVESLTETNKSRKEKNFELRWLVANNTDDLVMDASSRSAAEENRRVLRARDKLKKIEMKQTTSLGAETSEIPLKLESDTISQEVEEERTPEERIGTSETATKEPENPETQTTFVKSEAEATSEPAGRARRNRDSKKRGKEEIPLGQNTLNKKRSRKSDVRKIDQQNKEETLLDNEVATINENNRSLQEKYDKGLGVAECMRGFSEGGRGAPEKHHQDSTDSNRSKSENDIENVKTKSSCSDRLSHQRAESDTLKENENVDDRVLHSDLECKIAKTPETPQKDSDDASTSGESSSSLTLSKIDETPEDKAKKESILRLLGLESLEKAAERLNHQKARKEQQYTGTLKTVIRVQKDNKDKKRSRSPLKMVLKQGRGDGDGDSPEFYTIQKELGTSGLGDSSSGANRKFSTNHRHSCDEDNEESPPKDRQSLVIPEKSSSFSIHPGRLCADVCCYCFGKFGSLDTPMHLAQMKSDERRQKILSVEKHLNKDSCLCDACYRHVDRRANMSPTNMQTKPQRQHRQLMVSKCSARDCREPARHHIKRRWLIKVKAGVQHQVDINWESNQHTSMSFCVEHYSKIEPYLTCALCKRRLAKNHTHPLAATETEELNQRLGRQGIPVHFVAGTFVCKLCRYFTQLHLKYKYIENMSANHKNFCKTYRIRILHCHDIHAYEQEEEDTSPSTSKDKEKRKKAKCSQPNKGMSKSPDGTTNSEKSTPEPPTTKTLEVSSLEMDNDNRVTKLTGSEEAIAREVQLMDLESTVEKLKKRKALEQLVYSTESPPTNDTRSNDVLEILAMDKEVTLTRLPKRPRVSSDITPVVQRLGANPSISVRTLFPGEEEMNLHANVEFANVREITPQGWEKCATMIQYDRDTKLLWQELQRPYGNQSSFLRHLILLEKYYRSGDLVLAPNASRNAINYSTSVQNRLISYEGPEKMDEPIMEPISEYSNSRRLSGGYMMERERLSLPSTSTALNLSSNKSATTTASASNVLSITTAATTTSIVANTATTASTSHVSAAAQALKTGPPRVLKLTSGVSIIKKPPPSLQRLNLPSGSSSGTNGTPVNRRKETSSSNKIPVTSGGKVFQLSEAEFKRLQNLKKQKQLLSEQKQSSSPSSGGSSPSSTPNSASNASKTTTSSSSSSSSNALAQQYQKAQMAAQSQFQKHLRMQQEMLNRQTRGDFEPLICDVRPLVNENTPSQNLLNTLNLPKSIQVTTKPSNPIPILPKIPKSLTVIPQTVPRTYDK